MAYKYYCENLLNPQAIPKLPRNHVIDWGHYCYDFICVNVEIEGKIRKRIVGGYIIFQKLLSEEDISKYKLIYAGEVKDKQCGR